MILFRHLQHEYGEIEGFLNEVGVDKVTFRPENLGFVSEGAEADPAPPPRLLGGASTPPYQPEAKTRPTDSHRCHWLYVGMMVRPDGNAYPCCGRDFDRFAYGNLLEQPLDEIWNNDCYRFSRSLFQDGPDLPFDPRMVDLPCYECDAFKITRTMQGRDAAIASRTGGRSR